MCLAFGSLAVGELDFWVDLDVLELPWRLLPGIQQLRLGWEVGLSPGRASDYSSKSTASRRDSVKWHLGANLLHLPLHVFHCMRPVCLHMLCFDNTQTGCPEPEKAISDGEPERSGLPVC